MGTSLGMIKINKQDSEYKKFIQEVYPDKILSKGNIVDKYFKDKYNIHSIQIHLLKGNTYIYDDKISNLFIDNKNKVYNDYFKYSKLCSLYKYDFNNSIGYSFYNQGKLINTEAINWELELDKLNINTDLSDEEHDNIIEKFDNEVFSKKYSSIHDNLVKIERDNFKYSDIAEEGWDKVEITDNIIIKNKFEDLKILLKHYLLFSTSSFTNGYNNQNNIIFYTGGFIIFIISGFMFYAPNDISYLFLLLLTFYMVLVIVFKKYSWNKITQNIAITFGIYFGLMITHALIYTLIEIVKIKLI